MLMLKHGFQGDFSLISNMICHIQLRSGTNLQECTVIIQENGIP